MNSVKALALPPATAQPPPRLSLPVLLLALALFFYPLTDWVWDVGGIFVSYGDAFLVAALATFLTSVLIAGERFYLIGSTLLPLPLLAFAGAATGYLNDSLPSLVDFVKFLVAIYAVPYTVCWLVYSRPGSLRLLLTAWLGGCVFSALVAAFSSHGHAFLGFTDVWAKAGFRAYGLTWHPNSLAYCCALGSMVAWYLATSTASTFLRVLYLAGLGVLLYGVLIAGSRAVVVAMAPAALLMVFHGLRKNWGRKALAYLLLLGLGLAVVAVAVVMVPGKSVQGSALERFQQGKTDADVSDDWRRQLLNYSLDEVEKKPLLGSGYELLGLAHNNILQILQAGGLLALLGVAAWLFCMFRVWRETAQRQRAGTLPDADNGLLALIQAIVVVWLLVGLFQPFLTDRNAYIGFGLLLALSMRTAAAPVRLSQRAQRLARAGPPLRAPAR